MTARFAKAGFGSRRQHGAALIIALFLIVVVAAMGVFATNTEMSNQQTSTLALTEARVEAAAYSGLEYGSYQVRTAGAACVNAWAPILLTGTPPGTQGISVQWKCNATVPAPSNATVYVLSSRAFYSNFGQPDYVQRTLRRRVNTLGTW